MDANQSTVDELSNAADDITPQRLRGPGGHEVARAVAEQHGVCVRPIAMRATDADTGDSRVVPVACGATREAVCPSCAQRNRRLRAEQCRQGWHRDSEPEPPKRAEPDAEQRALMGYRAELITLGREALQDGRLGDVEDVREALGDVDTELRAAGVTGRLDPLETPPARRARSTRRHSDAPELPRKPVSGETVGRVYAGRYRPSMFVTLTLDSYGSVHAARYRNGRSVPCRCGTVHRQDSPVLGTPVDPESYDYRRAARDAVHFAKLVDRFWQNLRRAVGWNVQYFATVEAQRRLSPHLHAALRGSIPREVLRQVVAATYETVWWPAHGEPVYGGEHLPVWVPEQRAFCDPETRQPLPTFEEATPGPDAAPEEAAHVVGFGAQVDARGLLGGSEEANRHVGYLTKYLTKSLGETYSDASRAHSEHADRMLAELAITPCSPTCAVWLLHGIQPRQTRSTLRPGQCRANAHKRHTLGASGRRVLVSRQWSGKTLAKHAQDRQDYVRHALADAGITPHASDEVTSGRVVWEPTTPDDPDIPPRPYLLLTAVAQRRRWRAQYQRAREFVADADESVRQ